MTITAYSITEWAFLTEHPLFRKLIRKDPIAGWVLYRILWDYSAKERTEVFRCWESLDDLIDQLHLWTRFERSQIEKSLPALLSSKLCAYQDGVLYVYGSEKKHTSPRCKRWKETARQNLTEHDTLCQEMSRPVTTCQEIEKSNSEKPVGKPIRDTFVTENDTTRHDLTGSDTTRTCPSKSDTEHEQEHEHEHEHEQVTNNLNMNRNKDLQEPNAFSNPVVLRVAQDSENPDPLKPSTMCAAPLGKTPKLKDLTAVGEDGKRILTPEGEAFISEFHSCLIAEANNGKTGRRMRAYDMLVEIVKLNEKRSVALITMEPLTATLYLCSALIDTNTTPPQLLISLMKKKPDLRDTRIYPLVKAALNSEPVSTAKNSCKNEELW